MERITNPARVRRFVKFALIYKCCAALVIAEYLIIQVEAGDDRAEALIEAIAGLCIDLKVRQRPDIARWPFRSQTTGIGARDQCWRNIVVAEEAGLVIR